MHIYIIHIYIHHSKPWYSSSSISTCSSRSSPSDFETITWPRVTASLGLGTMAKTLKKKTMENHEEDGTKMQKMEKNEQKWKNWLVVLTILKNRKVSGKDDIPYMKWKIIQMFETTNQKRRPAWSESSG